ncbi:hypothetical protein EOPP23_10080 [Endozoicomonas sp. OPT23]|uniref:DUF2782 domain-containing protein n=1 Tax=Endozoicomonas sp. OPT23 TaxID=2072845 RepID=UPI00129A2F19|nr:DUF2782 domain-containing protein [Endozoicomonas sp. OPT23]MRI33331.1 hypothetical protein [Endozoicomonas sp. OPT23]
MKSLFALLILSLGLVGCSSLSKEPAAGSAPKPPHASNSSSSALPISKEDFEKIPKGLRPEQLEERDDTTVVIRPGTQKSIKEYRINGFLYGILVTPKVGKPYYLVAADHKGNFIDPSRPTLLIPSWTIFQWK